MIADSGSSLIASLVLVVAAGVTIWQCIVRSADRPWYGRVALTVVVTFLVTGVVGGALDAVGLDVDDEADATVVLRDELSAGGYTPAESDCVEEALIREYGSVDAVDDAADVRAAFTAMMTCKRDIGMDAAMTECWAGQLVDHFDIDRFDADAMSVVADAVSEPAHRRFAAVTSMTCQGVPDEVAECIYETVDAAHPEVLGDGTPGMTAEQQGWLHDAGRECGLS